MDPEKVKAVREWPTPDSRKQLQHFLGFTNFYRRFIRNYSKLAAPLTTLTFTSKQFVWSPEAESAFQGLKRHFTSAPILCHPDPTRQFIVEVDASQVGVGAVLSQRSSEDGKLYSLPSFLIIFLLQNATAMWGTRNCWLLSWLWKSGGIGWRAQKKTFCGLD